MDNSQLNLPPEVQHGLPAPESLYNPIYNDIWFVTESEITLNQLATTELDIRLSSTHNLKCDLEFFQAVLDKKKPFEVRNNDRDFHVGDFINLLEFDRGTSNYTGREIKAIRITYVLKDYPAIAEGYVVLGLDVSSY